jgi:hypothetical protein
MIIGANCENSLMEGSYSLSATEGDTVVAENLFEDFVNLLFEAGTLSLWRYRIVLSVIRAGL